MTGTLRIATPPSDSKSSLAGLVLGFRFRITVFCTKIFPRVHPRFTQMRKLCGQVSATPDSPYQFLAVGCAIVVPSQLSGQDD